MTEDYTKPFYVPFKMRHMVRGVSRDGYLPALELPDPVPPITPVNQPDYVELLRQKDQQLESLYYHLERRMDNLVRKNKQTTEDGHSIDF